MYGIEIADRRDGSFLTVDLVDILNVLGSLAEESEWEISEVECLGTVADKLHQLADTKVRVSGKTLLQLAANLTQVIEGVFAGYRNGESEPWIVIGAVDSSAYDVESTELSVLEPFRQKFKQVADLPQASYEAAV